jgi:hypothetical protein
MLLVPGSISVLSLIFQETAVRSFTRMNLALLALLVASVLPLTLPLPAHAGEDEYRLLELDGHMVKWGDRQLGVGASISYAFAAEPLRFDDAINCQDMESIEAISGTNLSMETLAREAAAAFRVWERAADLSFHQVGDARDADIILGAQGRPYGRAFASVAYVPNAENGVRAIEQALVCLNPDHGWKVGFDGNEDVYDIRYTLVHEIGHAIGLDHPGPTGQVMAFRYTEAFEDLQPGDLRGAQRLYGPAKGFEARLAEESTEVYHAHDLIGHSMMSTTLGLGGGASQPRNGERSPELASCGFTDGTTEQQ